MSTSLSVTPEVEVSDPAVAPAALFGALAADPEFTEKLAATGLSLQIVQPEGAFRIPAEGGTGLRLEFAPGTADDVWSGRLPLMQAVIGRRLKVKGPVAQIRVLGELLPSIVAHYRRLGA